MTRTAFTTAISLRRTIWLILLPVVTVGTTRVTAADSRVHKDLEFATVDGHSLKLDLYMPAASDPPLVVWIHGGGWRAGRKENCEVTWLTEHGYSVASISYRLTDKAIFPAQIHDCKAAVRWLRANAKKVRLQHGQDGRGGKQCRRASCRAARRNRRVCRRFRSGHSWKPPIRMSTRCTVSCSSGTATWWRKAGGVRKQPTSRTFCGRSARVSRPLRSGWLSRRRNWTSTWDPLL